tara:strand:- start:234 stop:401 length:168 start_codon:yes stop_codon:yes gene_type:complete
VALQEQEQGGRVSARRSKCAATNGARAARKRTSKLRLVPGQRAVELRRQDNKAGA